MPLMDIKNFGLITAEIIDALGVSWKLEAG
jgi:hypothetical protein